MQQARVKNVPEQEMFQNVISWQPREFQEWMSGLPDKPHQACRKICSAIHQLNNTSVEIDVRNECLLAFTKKLGLLERQVEREYLTLPSPLTGVPQEQLEWLVWSYMRLARGLLLSMGSVHGVQHKCKLGALAMHVLARVYLHVSSIYCQPDLDFWPLCYQLYSSAEKDGVLESSVEIVGLDSPASIQHIFISILLLSVSDHQRFRPGEMRSIYSILFKNADLVKLQVNIDQKMNADNFFVVDLQCKEPPFKLENQQDLMVDSSRRYFNPVDMAHKVYVMMQSGALQKQVGKIDASVVEKAVKTLGRVQKRRFNRHSETGTSVAIVGLEYFLTYLTQRNKKAPRQSKIVDSFNPRYEYNTDHFELVGEGEELVYKMNSALVSGAGEDHKVKNIFSTANQLSRQAWVDPIKKINSKSITPDEYTVLNRGAKGYGLAIRLCDASLIVGELFAVLRDDGKYEIGVIRHLRNIQNESVHLGVELLGISEGQVELQMKIRSNVKTTAVFLPELKAIKQPNTLILNSHEFKEGDFLTLTQGKTKHSCRLTKAISVTPCYKQFGVSFLHL